VNVRLTVRVQPGAKQAGLAGRTDDGTLKVRVTAPPEGGRANRAVEELMADTLGVARRQVTVVRGTTARTKWIEIAGLTAADVEARVNRALHSNEEHDGD
jgi:uncharacterized protein (TIGR00251 family)